MIVDVEVHVTSIFAVLIGCLYRRKQPVAVCNFLSFTEVPQGRCSPVRFIYDILYPA